MKLVLLLLVVVGGFAWTNPEVGRALTDFATVTWIQAKPVVATVCRAVDHG